MRIGELDGWTCHGQTDGELMKWLRAAAASECVTRRGATTNVGPSQRFSTLSNAMAAEVSAVAAWLARGQVACMRDEALDRH